MATVVIQRHKKKNGFSYSVIYRDPISGQKKHFKTFQKQRQAQQAANDLRALLDAGKLPDRAKARIRPLSFKEVADSLIDEWGLRVAKGELTKKTHYDYCIWLNGLNRVFGKKMLSQISKEEIEIYRTGLALEHSNVTANKYLSTMKKVFSHGFKLKAVIEEPTLEIHYLSEKEHERNTFLLPHKLDKLIDATQKNRGKFYMPAIIYLGAEHGAAKQEILDLKWKHIDFEYAGKGLIRLYRTKNKKERVEFLMPRTREALLSWRDHLERKRKRDKVTKVKSDSVFCRIDGTSLKSFHNAWRASLREAGIKNFHFHDLRHTFCSNLLLSGAGLKEVKEMIGHSDISMTDRYAHLTIEFRHGKQQQLAEHYSNNK
jgi:integrase